MTDKQREYFIIGYIVFAMITGLGIVFYYGYRGIVEDHSSFYMVIHHWKPYLIATILMISAVYVTTKDEQN